MKKEIIYEKTYAHDEFIEIPQEDDDTVYPSAEEFLKILQERYEKTVYVPMPGRVEAAEEFIKQAIYISNKYEINVIVIQRDDCISVKFSFNHLVGHSDVGRLFGMADEIYFLKGDDEFNISIILEYYTHTAIR